MSRSRRKTPIAGIANKETDKPFKEAEHRRERRVVKSVIETGEDPPAPKKFGNPWASMKDGKRIFDPTAHPKLMRK